MQKLKTFQDIQDIFGNTKLHNAVKNNNIREVEALLKNGADVNSENNVGKTPLFYVYGVKGRYLTKILIDNGADVNKRDRSGKTPLGWAIKNNSIEIAELIIDNGGIL